MYAKAMESLVADGHARSIGVSNFGPARLEALLMLSLLLFILLSLLSLLLLLVVALLFLLPLSLLLFGVSNFGPASARGPLRGREDLGKGTNGVILLLNKLIMIIVIIVIMIVRNIAIVIEVSRRGTSGVSPNGVTATFIVFFDRDFLYFIFPKVPGRTLFPNLPKFITFAAAP